MEDIEFDKVLLIEQDKDAQSEAHPSNQPLGHFDEQTIVKTQQIMALQSRLTPNPQGGDCWGNFFFQFSNNNSLIRIYNLEEQELIQKYSLDNTNRGFVNNCHCNSVCFGSKYYDENDEIPLLYVSTGYGKDGYTGALVYRVMRTNDRFTFSLVQTIRFPVLDSSWTEFIPADDYCYICYTSNCLVYKMPLPSVHDGDVILDGSKDAIDVYQFPQQPKIMGNSRNQDRMYYNERIVLISGVPQSGEASVLVVLDLETRTYAHVFNFLDMGLSKEPESVFMWKGNLCVAFLNKIVSFEFNPSVF